MCGGAAGFITINVLPNKTPFDVDVCRACGHGVRKQSRTFDENVAIQEEVFDVTTRANLRPVRWYARPRLIARQIEKLLGRKGKVLDIGCGAGVYLRAFGKGWQRYGVDVSPRAAELTRANTGAVVFCGPIEQYEDAPKFDAIIALALIEHLTDPQALIDWAREHLVADGVLVLLTGDRDSEVARDLGVHWPMYKPVEHVHFFSGRSLTALVERSGMEVLHTEWRPAHYKPAPIMRYWSRFRELVGMIRSPYWDRVVVYARPKAG